MVKVVLEDARLSRAARGALFALVFGGIAAILDSTIVAIAIHPLVTDLQSSTLVIQWVSTGYLLAMAVAIPVTGWLGDRFGGKRAWIVGLTIFVVASAACATAWDPASLIVFRVIQGLGAGLIFPLMQTLAMRAVGTGVSSRVLGKAMAAITMPLALGPIIGPVVGGVILNWLSWRWLFLVNVPLVAVGIVLAIRLLAQDPPPASRATARLDWIGLVLLAPALGLILLGLSNVASSASAASPSVWIPLGSGVLLIVGFVAWAVRRGDAALVHLKLLRSRNLGVASVVLFCAGAAMYAGTFLLPLYWQQLRGETVLSAAFLLIPQGVGALAARGLAGILTARFGARIVTGGAFLLTFVATIPFAIADAHTNTWWLCTWLFVRGLGIGAVIIPPMMVAYQDLAGKEVPHATMLTRITQQVGASFGVAIVAVALHSLGGSGSVAQTFQSTFWWINVIAVLAIVPVLAFRGTKGTP
ncbi:MAG TPA: DHA2 family efflux MFS transporter permease subunit [Microbacteriaceae bacterium]|nr:DHA2 family efflux MFS transporter permease subunit [Microbacteriaceae bacterium]